MRLLTAFSILALAGCAMPTGDFPSLAKRPIESRGDAIVGPPPSTAVPDPAAAKRAQALGGQLADAARAFDAALPEVRRTAARAGAAGSESWIAAQLALTRLEGVWGRTVEVLGEVDRLLVGEYSAARPVAAETVALADAAREQAEAQARAIAEVRGRFSGGSR